MKRIMPALLATAALLGGTAFAQDMRIVVVTHGQAADPFWSVVKNGVDAAAKDMGARVEYHAPESFDMVKMSQLIEAAVASQPDGLAVSIPDAAALSDAIRAAVDSGIPVISMNSGSDVSDKLGVLVHVGQEEYLAGKGAGTRMQNGRVKHGLCINHEQGNVALDQRCQGFEDGLGGEVEQLATSLDPTEIRNAVTAYLTKNPEIDGILTVGSLSAEPTLVALEEQGLVGTIQLATFDLSPAVLEALREGKMSFAIDQQQYLQGYLPVVFLTLYHKYGLLPGADVQTGPGFVTQQQAEQVIELSKQGIR